VGFYDVPVSSSQKATPVGRAPEASVRAKATLRGDPDFLLVV
jgi:hypothetical protein